MPKKIKLNGPVIGDGSTWLYDWLGMPYIGAAKLSKELDDARGEDIELYINSPGGAVFAGSEVYTILKEYPGKVTAKVTGVAASAASFFLMAADEIKMSPPSQLMIHNAARGTDGDKNIHFSNANMLNNTDIGITNAYRLKTGKSTEELIDLMNKTTWMNAQQAVEFGFADGILFDDENALMSVTNSISGEIPPDVETKIRDVLINAVLKGDVKSDDKRNLFAGLDLSAITPELSNSLGNQDGQHEDDAEPQTKEEESIMDQNELKAKHPDLYNEIVDSAEKAERDRVTSLQAYASAPGAAEFVNEAITNGGTVQDVAMKVMEASMKRNGQEAKNRQQDAEESNVDQVVTIEAKTPDAIKDEKKADTVASMVAMAQKMKSGGRK